MVQQSQGGYFLDTVSADKWKKIGLVKRSGMFLPLFSAYSGESLGIGEIQDLRLIIDLCIRTGNSILQLLPLNNLGSTFCPYDAVSSFAL
ncbi:MAG: 4-alpha-glucanotransferase, partial [Deltaproteobacteria bacterium]